MATSKAPTVSSFLPVSGPVGTVVKVSGTHFIGGVTVRFGNIVSTNVVVSNRRLLKATVPPGAPSGPIRVVTKWGTAVSSKQFTVITVPVPEPEPEPQPEPEPEPQPEPTPTTDLYYDSYGKGYAA
jgi:hypothetical protein